MAVKTRAELKSENASDFPDNTARLISAGGLRGQMNDTADSMLMDEDIAGLDLSEAHVTAIGDGTQTLAEWTSSILSGEAGDFSPPWTGAITWPVTQRMQQQVYLLDFIPLSEHAAILNSTSTYDCSDAFEAAQDAISVEVADNPNFYQGGPEVIFPYGTCYFDRTIELKRTMTLSGQAQGGRTSWASRLLFKAGITGITVNSRTGYRGDMDPPVLPPPSGAGGSPGGDSCTIRHLKIHSKSLGVRDLTLNETGWGCASSAGVALWDNDHHGMGHGIWCRARVNIEHCVIQHFPQHGIYVRASAVGTEDTPEGRAIYGNANNMYIAHTASLSNAGWGMYIDGPDTNAGVFIGMDFGANLQGAVRDSSLIGNTHIAPHAADNGKDSFCSYQEVPGVSQDARYYCRDAWRANNDAPAWATSTYYLLHQYVKNAGNLYRCILRDGLSAASGTGPTGTGLQITDGTTFWKFVVADAGIKIPPLGHAQSADVWGWTINTPGPVGTVETHPDFPKWPNKIDGVTPKYYRLGHSYWFDNSTASNVLIGPYTEGSGAYSIVTAPSLAIGILQYDAASNGIKLQGSLSAAVIGPGIQVAAQTSVAAPNEFVTSISRVAGEAITLQAAGDGAPLAVNTPGLAFNWDDASGNWMIQRAHSGSQIAQQFTTTLTTTTGGRASIIGPGNSVFGQGLWLGRTTLFSRHLTMGEAIPATGQWAAGDMVLNAQPLMGEPWGWRCILTGDFAATPPVFQPMRDVGSQQSIADVAFTLTPGTSPHHTRHTGTMTADRAVTLSTTGALVGLSYRITRTSAGAFNLNVGTGPLKALAAGQWCEVVYDGSAYYLSAYGTL